MLQLLFFRQQLFDLLHEIRLIGVNQPRHARQILLCVLEPRFSAPSPVIASIRRTPAEIEPS